MGAPAASVIMNASQAYIELRSARLSSVEASSSSATYALNGASPASRRVTRSRRSSRAASASSTRSRARSTDWSNAGPASRCVRTHTAPIAARTRPATSPDIRAPTLHSSPRRSGTSVALSAVVRPAALVEMWAAAVGGGVQSELERHGLVPARQIDLTRHGAAPLVPHEHLVQALGSVLDQEAPVGSDTRRPGS